MSIDLEKIAEIIGKNKVLTDNNQLNDAYCKPFIDGTSITPMAALFPKNADQISQIIKYLRTINGINVVVISSNTFPKFLDDTISSKNTIIIDLHEMKEISFINRRNRVCVVEPGVTWSELIPKLKEHGMRPLAPLLPRNGKSALASVLDREPHLIPKKQYDISDPLLCMEVIFGNGELFRTGEAAGPQSIEANRKFGGALTNPLGPAQTDIFRLIQGAKGSYGISTWVSMQCDLIPEKRIIKFVESDTIEPLTEFIYTVVRRRWIDEVFMINDNLFNAIFPSISGTLKKYILIYAINGYELFPEDKIAYQLESCDEILDDIGVKAENSLAGVSQKDLELILDGNTVDPHPKYSDKSISIDVFYNTTLDRLQDHLSGVEEILKKNKFPQDRMNIYLQPVIQAHAVNAEFSLIADRPDSDPQEFMIEKVKEICKDIAQFISSNGGFFSRSYKLINDFAFSRDDAFEEGLRKIKKIFDPDEILNKGQLIS
ncbi:MAG: FAD-binding oxidoreductase [Candidatus Hodarchaeota archaeon]